MHTRRDTANHLVAVVKAACGLLSAECARDASTDDASLGFDQDGRGK